MINPNNKEYVMYNNEKPFGLLSDAQKAEIQAHYASGGKIQIYTSRGWSNLDRPSWITSTAYRAVYTAPTPDKVNWELLPLWATAVARDANGTVWMFKTIPSMYAYGWHEGLTMRRIDDFPHLVEIGTCDWKDSLHVR